MKGLFPQPAALPSNEPLRSPPNLPPLSPTPRVPQAAPVVTEYLQKAGPISMQLHSQRLAIAAAAVIGCLATFMPWAHLPIVGAIDGTGGDGWLTLALFAAALYFALSGSRGQPIGGWPQLVAIICPVLAGLIGALKIYSINAMASDLASNANSGTLKGAMEGLVAQAVRPKFGLYALVIAGVGGAAAAVILNPQRLSLPKGTPLRGQISLPRLANLPIHLQRLAVALLALLGAAATFMPWLKSADNGPVYRIDAARSAPRDIAEAHGMNVKYAKEMGKQMGKNAETIRDIQSVAGTSPAGAISLAMFATAVGVSLYGSLRREISGWVRHLVMVTPLLASALGLWEVVQVGVKDHAVRVAVQEHACDRGIRQNLSRLDQPVLKAGYGLWVVILCGIATTAAVPLLRTKKPFGS